MTYTLTLCLGMFLGICGSGRSFEYPTHAECEQARLAVPARSIGSGYAICAPTERKVKHPAKTS